MPPRPQRGTATGESIVDDGVTNSNASVYRRHSPYWACRPIAAERPVVIAYTALCIITDALHMQRAIKSTNEKNESESGKRNDASRRVYDAGSINGCVSVRPSACPVDSNRLSVHICRRSQSVDICRRPSCGRGQRHVESRGTRLNADWF